MTLGDVLALVAGVAVAYALVAGLPTLPLVRTPRAQLLLSTFRLLQGTTLAVAAVALARVGVYRRMPRPAEWLAILVGGSLLTDRPELNLDGWTIVMQGNFVDLNEFDFAAWRWGMAWRFTLWASIGLGFLRLVRHHSPTWLKTLLLAGVAILALAGPFWMIASQGTDLVTPASGFGPGLPSALFRTALMMATALPIGVLFGMPAVAASAERIAGRRWNWPEWAALGSSIMTGLGWMMTYRWEFPTLGAGFLVERSLGLTWLIAVICSSRFLLIRFGPGFGRWVEGPSDQIRPPSSATDSAASTR